MKFGKIFRSNCILLKLNRTTASSAASVPGATMSYRQLEESINKWTIELEEQEKIFLNQATQVGHVLLYYDPSTGCRVIKIDAFSTILLRVNFLG